MLRFLSFLYGVVAYSFGIAALTYFVFFSIGVLVPVTSDTGSVVGITEAFLIDVALVLLIATQHTIMARKGFKAVITRFIPKAIERSTFVLASGAAFVTLMMFWKPIPITLWHVQDGGLYVALYAIAFAGWGFCFFSSFLINHFDLFGLRQVWINLQKQAYTPVQMGTPFIYKLVRHPMMTGILLGIWVTPVMTGGHLLLAVLFTLYILMGTRFEEKDLVADYGQSYVDYQMKTPSLFPRFYRKYRKPFLAEMK